MAVWSSPSNFGDGGRGITTSNGTTGIGGGGEEIFGMSSSAFASMAPTGVGNTSVGVVGGGGGNSSSVVSAAAGTMMSVVTTSVDPGSLLNQQLAAALSTMGDAQYWEESMSPNQIRTDLDRVCDPVNSSSSHIGTQLKCMKWLLANISKGRDVSDFYPSVIKLVGATSLEVRKMVYMFTVQYANHDNETREMSLLSINAFQRGLVDTEPLIRGLALRVLTSLHINDIIQIQILAVQTCTADTSPYVRKCAANAVAKLAPRIPTDEKQQQQATQELLMDILQNLLDKDSSTMVLTSALTSFSELLIAHEWMLREKSKQKAKDDDDDDEDDDLSDESDDEGSDDDDNPGKRKAVRSKYSAVQLGRLHGSFRKICHLLTDMDEWGQVIVIDVLSRYCRLFFKRPINQTQGTAERIDKLRRVHRPDISIDNTSNDFVTTVNRRLDKATKDGGGKQKTVKIHNEVSVTLPPREVTGRKVKRRVVKQGFYSDEEDESTEEEVIITPSNHVTARNALQQPIPVNGTSEPGGAFNTDTKTNGVSDNEDSELSPDHRLLLQSAFPLLKSRNAGVVLSVCSLHYYCGVASVNVRSAMGKALVRIVHTCKQQDTRRDEIQYIILNSIRQLVVVCPSAFAPYMHDFFINPTQDAHFTRLIKLDILIQLALEPAAIETVLNELRTYIRLAISMSEYREGVEDGLVSLNMMDDSNYDDMAYATDIDHDIHFACMSIRAVGRVSEMARIVYERHAISSTSSSSGTSTSPLESDRAEANRIALNCLFGLLTITETASVLSPIVTGEVITVMHQIIRMLQSPTSRYHDDSSNSGLSNAATTTTTTTLHDPNRIQERAFRQILFFLLYTLDSLSKDEGTDDDDDDGDSDVDGNDPLLQLEDICGSTILPARATAVAIALVGEVFAPYSASHENFKASFGNLFPRVSSSSSLSSSSNPVSHYRTEISRLLSRCFLSFTTPEKEQAIHFASRILISNKDSPATFSVQEVAIAEHILSMGRVDVNPDVRDRARFESNVISLSVGLQYDSDGMEDYRDTRLNQKANGGTVLLAGLGSTNETTPSLDVSSSGPNRITLQQAKAIFLRRKPASSSLPLTADDRQTLSPEGGVDLDNVGYRFGTLSSLVGHRARSAYLPLPPWAIVNSPDSLRDPVPERTFSRQVTSTSSYAGDISNNGNTKETTNNKKPDQQFYTLSSSGDDSESSESDESESDEESSDDDDNESDRGVSGVIHTNAISQGSLLPQPATSKLKVNNVPVRVENDSSDSADSSSDSDDTDADDDREVLFPSATKQSIGLQTSTNVKAIGETKMGAQSSSYAENDLKGLVWTSSTSTGGGTSTDSSKKRDFGTWFQLVRSEHSGGLCINARYLRGEMKAQQARSMGLVADKPTVVSLQVVFKNTKMDNSTPLRHIRILQRSTGTSASSGSTITPRKVALPPEIGQLAAGQEVECFICIDFTSASDREGSLLAKLEIRIGGGGAIPVDIKPNLVDLLLPCQQSIDSFDKSFHRMQGFQRLEAIFTTTELASMREKIPYQIISSAALTPVPDDATIQWSDDQIRFAGTLPASMNLVLVLVTYPKSSSKKEGTIVVCCENALAINTIMNVVKKAVLAESS